MKLFQYRAINENTIYLNYGEEEIKIHALTPKVWRIFSQETEKYPSCAIEERPLPLPIEEVRAGEQFQSGKMEISLHHGDLIFFYEGRQIAKTFVGERRKKDYLEDDFLKLLEGEGHQTEQKKENPIKFAFALRPEEAIYGLGDKTGFLNKRNYEYEMWNTDNPAPQEDNFRALYKSIPFCMVLGENIAYGLFFDNHERSFFDLGKTQNNVLAYEAEGGAADIYIISGEDLKDVLQSYTELTGRTPLPQLWTLGYHQSRWGYRSEEEIRAIAENMRKYDLPCDAIHFDIDYMEGYRVFTWNRKRYLSPEKTLADFKAMGMKPVVIIDPGVKVDAGYSVYEEGIKNGFFACDRNHLPYVNEVWPGDSVFPDFGRQEVRDWWGRQHQFLLDMGVCGVWNDMNEPASFRGPLPEDIVFYDEDRPSTHKSMHNVYGHNMAKATYFGLRSLAKERPFIITRACYAGTQKYSTVWTGDNHSIWSHLRMAIPQLCNLGMSGFAFAGTDVGGFGSDTTPELLARWYQIGAFSPLFRNHSALGTISQEPWCFGEEILQIAKKYINLRYELLPYLYDLFYEGTKTGLPVMRPLVLSYPWDKEVRNQNDQFMVGDSILVSPVVEQGATRKMVYLPEGDWYCYWTKKKYRSGYHIVDAGLDFCPIFVKSGTILPKYPVYLSVGEHKDDVLILEVYGEEAEGIHYQDNGTDYAFEQGEYNLYHFTYQSGKPNQTLLHQGYQNYKEIRWITFLS